MTLPNQPVQKWQELTAQATESKSADIENLLQDISLNEPNKTIVHLVTMSLPDY